MQGVGFGGQGLAPVGIIVGAVLPGRGCVGDDTTPARLRVLVAAPGSMNQDPFISRAEIREPFVVLKECAREPSLSHRQRE